MTVSVHSTATCLVVALIVGVLSAGFEQTGSAGSLSSLVEKPVWYACVCLYVEIMFTRGWLKERTNIRFIAKYRHYKSE